MDIVARSAAAFGSAPAIITPERCLSFTDCEEESGRIAGELNRLGIGSGDVVAVMAPSSPSLLLTLMALLRIGAVSAPLNHRFPPEHTSGVLGRLKPRLLLLDDSIPMPPSAPATLSLQTVACDGAKAPRIAEGLLSTSMERSATILHTSASSGIPKAVLHTFANHWYNAKGANMNMPFVPGDCWLLSLPLYHVGGYSLLFRALSGGGALALDTPETALEVMLTRLPVTHLSLVPTQLYRLLRRPAGRMALKGLKALLLGGSAIPAPLLEEAAHEELPVYLTYGSTEMGSQIATSEDPIGGTPGSGIKILPFRELSINEQGEILVKGECLFQGYLEEGKIQSRRDRDGWFNTGDIGILQSDGSLSILGRRDNMFISGGENLHPEEIEQALMELEGIEQALVVPVEEREFGFRPAAFIQFAADSCLKESDIQLELVRKLGRLKTPAAIFRVTEWSTLAGSGKIDRAWYRQLAARTIQER